MSNMNIKSGLMDLRCRQVSNQNNKWNTINRKDIQIQQYCDIIKPFSHNFTN